MAPAERPVGTVGCESAIQRSMAIAALTNMPARPFKTRSFDRVQVAFASPRRKRGTERMFAAATANAHGGRLVTTEVESSLGGKSGYVREHGDLGPTTSAGAVRRFQCAGYTSRAHASPARSDGSANVEFTRLVRLCLIVPFSPNLGP